MTLAPPSAIRTIADRLRARNGDGGLDVQMLCLAEEVGEVIQAYRRATGRARQSADWASVAEELADVVIVAQVTAELAGIDLAAAVTGKLAAIEPAAGSDPAPGPYSLTCVDCSECSARPPANRRATC